MAHGAKRSNERPSTSSGADDGCAELGGMETAVLVEDDYRQPRAVLGGEPDDVHADLAETLNHDATPGQVGDARFGGGAVQRDVERLVR